MERKEKRQKIDDALTSIVIPFLREKGFKGSMPHFRRNQKDRINLLTFQHSFYDTKFVVEIANCPLDGITTHWGKVIPANKMKAHDMAERLRLGSEKHKTDYWFDYGKNSIFGNVYTKRAKEILNYGMKRKTGGCKTLSIKRRSQTVYNTGYSQCYIRLRLKITVNLNNLILT